MKRKANISIKLLCVLLGGMIMLSGAIPAGAAQIADGTASRRAVVDTAAEVAIEAEVDVLEPDVLEIDTIVVEPELEFSEVISVSMQEGRSTSVVDVALNNNDRDLSLSSSVYISSDEVYEINVSEVESAAYRVMQGDEYATPFVEVTHSEMEVSTSEDRNVAPMSTGSVTFIYRGNGHTSGTVPANHVLITPGETNLRPQGNLARTGHTFAGWRDGGGGIFTAGGRVNFTTPVSGSITLDAHWLPNVVTVTYVGNGHTGGAVPAGHTVSTPGSFEVRPPGTMTRTGHAFIGWGLPTGSVAAPGAVINLTGGGTIRLYALWSPNVVTFTYRSTGHTGGVPPANQSFGTPGLATVSGPGSLVRTNYTLAAWRDGAGNLVPVGETVVFHNPISGFVNFDAFWLRNRVTVTYDGNGHTGGSVPGNTSFDTPSDYTLRAPINLTRPGHVFNGWRQPGGQTVFQPGDRVPVRGSGTLRFEAVWSTASLTIHYRSVGHTSGSPPANQTLATPGSIRLSGQGSLVRPGFALIGWRRTNGTVYQLNSVASWSTQTTGIAAFDAVWVPIVTMRYNVFANPSTTVAAGQGFVDTVKPYFMSNFGIDLVQNSAGLVTTQLNQRSGCESDDRCSPACGDEADGADCWQRHHRASRHFLNVSRSNGVVSNFRFVDYRLCFFGMRADGTLGHMMVGGLAYLGRHDMIVTTASLLDARHITAHEISHLFNAQDNECTPGQQCVMRTVFFTYNQWCDTCRQSIMTFRGQ